MNKGFLKSQLESIEYKGQAYPVKHLTNAHDEEDYVATESLLEALGYDTEAWSDEERNIDEMMAYYLSEEDFNQTDDRIYALLHEAGCMIAEE